MTTSSDRSKPRASSPQPDPAVSVTSELEAVDTSLLEQLIATRAQQVQLKDYLAKADARRDQVSEAVWKRVVEDYRHRANTLDAASAPLENDVRREYAKLRTLLDSIQRINDEAQLEKDEYEFRHEIGELSKADLKKQLAEPEQQLAQCATDLAAVNERKMRFLEAFDSEEDLLVEAPAELPEEPTEIVETPAAPAAATMELGNAQGPPAPKPTAPDDTDRDGSSEPDELNETQPPSMTRVLSPEDLMQPPARNEPTPSDDDEGGRTFLLPAAALLVMIEGEEAATEHRLAALNYIGRSEENQLRMARPGISRKHALVAATVEGFTIQDLESQNGTYVNGQQVTEHELADGDEIVIGDVRLIFRLPWPEPAGDAR